MRRQTFILLLAGVALAGGRDAHGQVAGRYRLALQTFSITARVGNPAYEIRIAQVSRVGLELWVVCRVNQFTEEPVPQVVVPASDRLALRAPNLPVRYFVTGNATRSPGEDHYIHLDELTAAQREAYGRRMVNAELWYGHDESYVTTLF